MIKWHIGTMGFGYKDWSGVFYPAGMSARNYLSYYSRIFNAVEIDTTFYGIPRLETVRRWASVSPASFQFCLKTPNVITHDLKLVGASGLMSQFVERVRLLEEKLGVILIQLPPSFRVDQLDVLDEFLSGLPADIRFAVEIRDRSWYTAKPQMNSMLSKHGVSWAATQYPGLPREINLTADFSYIRWIGQHGSYKKHYRERVDLSTELQKWWWLILEVQDQLESVYGFTNNDYAGFAPATANRFKKIAGLETQEHRPHQQGRLF
jgi:uncharacterized protein YecE (DUF72 family)